MTDITWRTAVDKYSWKQTETSFKFTYMYICIYIIIINHKYVPTIDMNTFTRGHYLAYNVVQVYKAAV